MYIQFEGTALDPAAQHRIGELLAALQDERLRQTCRRLEIKVHPSLPQDTVVEEVHAVWKAEALQGITSPQGGPRLSAGALCPRGAMLVEVAYVQRLSGGMSSYYQFAGWFLSLVVAADFSAILDARIEKAI